MRNLLLAAVALLLLLPVRLPAQTKPAPKAAVPDTAFAEVKDDPALPRVLLIGDSISIGYTVPVRKLLAGKANVHRIPENVGPTTHGLAKLARWLGDGKWDAIHFNWGLHDLKRDGDDELQVSLADYERNLTQLVRQLKATKARLIWATTTPVPDAHVRPTRRNSDVVAYNDAAREIMKANGIALDDLYAFALPRLEKLQQPANVHFTQGGSEALAERVAASLREALGK